MNKIRGNVIGTPIKPEKSILKATDLTDEQKAQARANIGVTDVSWTSIVNATLTADMLDPSYLYRCMWDLESINPGISARIQKMSEFKLLIRLPFAEAVSKNAFEIRAFLANAASSPSAYLVMASNVECGAGQEIFVASTSTKIGGSLFNVVRQNVGGTALVAPLSDVRAHSNVFDVREIWFKFNLTNKYPLPVGTQIVLEGR